MDENERKRSWQARVDEFWRTADDEDPEATLATMNALIADRRPDDPSALFELASTYDFLGQEGNAIPLYRRALQGGLDEESAARATVQLASSLRNVGEPAEAVALLEHLSAPALGHAPAAFLALALHSAGKTELALATALTALAETLPTYGRAVREYAAELGKESRGERT